MIRVWRIPFSTNVERVALALGHKGLEAEWVDVDRNDRTTVIQVALDRGWVHPDQPFAGS